MFKDKRFDLFLEDKPYLFAKKLMEFCLERTSKPDWEEFSKKNQFPIILPTGPMKKCEVIFRQRYARCWIEIRKDAKIEEAVGILRNGFEADTEITPQKDHKAIGVKIFSFSQCYDLMKWLTVMDESMGGGMRKFIENLSIGFPQEAEQLEKLFLLAQEKGIELETGKNDTNVHFKGELGQNLGCVTSSGRFRNYGCVNTGVEYLNELGSLLGFPVYQEGSDHFWTVWDGQEKSIPLGNFLSFSEQWLTLALSIVNPKEKSKDSVEVKGFVYGKNGFERKKKKKRKRKSVNKKVKQLYFAYEDDLDLGDLKELQLSNKAKKCLRRSGIDSIEKLEQVSDEQLLSTPWTGMSTVRSIREALSLYTQRRSTSISDGGEEKNLDELDASQINDVLNLSARAKNCLRHISTIGELRKLSSSELISIRNMGRRTTQEIQEKLKELIGSSVSEVDGESLGNLNLSFKARKFANLKGIESISDLEKISDQDVLSVRGMGIRTLNEIRDKIAIHFREKANQSIESEGDANEFCTAARRIAESGESIFKVHPRLINHWRNIIRQKNYDQLLIREVGFEAGVKWPVKKSRYSDMKIHDLLDLSWYDLLNLPAFGKRKAFAFYKILSFLAAGLWEQDITESNAEAVHRIISQLPGLKEIEVKVLEERIGKDTSPKTLEQIAKTQKVTRERIRQIQKSGLNKLRTSRNLEVINEYLTSNEKQIWFQLGGVEGIISESDKFDALADQLPYDVRFCIQVYTGSKVSGERFPNILRAFLNNRYKSTNGCWYNLPIDPMEIEALISIISGEFSAKEDFISQKSLIHKYSNFGIEKVGYALAMADSLFKYKGYIAKQSFNASMKRAVKFHMIIAYLSNDQKEGIEIDEICKIHNQLEMQKEISPVVARMTLLDHPSVFSIIHPKKWIILGEAEMLTTFYSVDP